MTAAAGRAVVIGGGVFGAASALELRSRGWAVTLLDPHPLPYEGAASTDVSKLVRMDYGSDVPYHELAERALEGWDRWNRDWPRPLYHEDGLLVLSKGSMTAGTFEHESWRVLRERGYEPERMAGGALARRFPAWRHEVYSDGYYNRRAGWAESGAVVERLLAVCEDGGVARRTAGLPVPPPIDGDAPDATTRCDAAFLIDAGSRVRGVRTSDGSTLEAERVVVCAGAWAPALMPWLRDRLHAVGLPVLYFGVETPHDFQGPAFPPWTADIAGSGWYGFPALEDGRVKLGYHGRGVPCDPDHRGGVSDAHVAKARAFLRDAIPALAEAPLVGRRVCLYCDAFDGDFLIGEDPEREGLVVAGGGSGHAFKFAPVLGGLVADAVERRSNPWSERFGWRAAGRPDKEEARYSRD